MESSDYIQLGDLDDYMHTQEYHESHQHQPNHSRKSVSKNNDHNNRQPNQQRPGPKSGRYWESTRPQKRNLQHFSINEQPNNMRYPPYRDESYRYSANNRNGSRYNVQVTFPTVTAPSPNKNHKNRRNSAGGGGQRDNNLGGGDNNNKPKQLLNPFSAANQAKLQRLNKVKQKRARANQARLKVVPPPGLDRTRLGVLPTAAPKNKKIVFLDDDDDSRDASGSAIEGQPSTSSQFKLPATPTNAGQSKQRVVSMVDDSSGSMEVRIKGSDPNFSDDDVIEIPVPPPEVVTLDDSDEECSSKAVEKEVPTPRCLSPSNSSMMSDDFIERSDRNRLRDFGGKDNFYWGGQEDGAAAIGTSAEHVPVKAMSVSSSSESTADNHDTTTESTNVGPIIRGEAVERCYDKAQTQTARRSGGAEKGRTSSSLNAENLEGKDCMAIFTEMVFHASDDDDNDEEEQSEPTGDDRPPALEEDPDENRCESPDNDVMLNVVTNNPQDIRQAMPDAGERPPPFEPTGPEVGWNEEMRRFYHESWGCENFSVSNLLFPMSRDTARWQIDFEDKFPRPPPRMNVRCRNCQEFTHKVQNCPLPKKKTVCFMCGDEGHRQPRCPNTVCLTCGAPAKTFLRNCHRCSNDFQSRCALCNGKGHSYVRCPDKWRRYHNTTEDNVDLNQEYRPNNRQYCSVCTDQGHLAHNCLKASRAMDYQMPKTRIYSYVPLYEHKPATEDDYLVKNQTENSYSLISFNENFKFKWSKTVGKHPHGYYNRFRDVVGLEPDEDEVAKTQPARRGRKRTRDEADDDLVEIVNIDYSQISQKSSGQNTSIIVDEEIIDDDDSDAERELVIDENAADKSKQFEDADENELVVSVPDNDTSLRDFSFNNELKKVLETREFHLDIDSTNQLEENTPEVVFENEQEALEKTAESLHTDVGSLKLVMANSMVSFPIESPEPGEYIPLEKRVRVEEQKCEGKLLLSKNHATKLMEDGGIFLKEMEQKHNLYLSVIWDSVGNILTMYGSTKNQTAFMKEMEEFCKRVTLEEHRKQMETSMQCMPKNPKKIMMFIREHLQRLKNEWKTKHEVMDAFSKMVTHMRSHQYKAADRCRKTLNVFLLGRIGLWGGKDAVVGMVKIHDQLDKLKTESLTIPEEMRKELNEHMSYIFTAMDHGNYKKLIHDYDECNKNKSWPLKKSQIHNIGELRKLIHRTEVGGPAFYIDKGPLHVQNQNNDNDSPDSTTIDDSLIGDSRPPALKEEYDDNNDNQDEEEEDFIPIGNDTINQDPTTPTSSTSAAAGAVTASTSTEVLYDPRRPQDPVRYYSCVRDSVTNTLRTTDTNEIITINPTIKPVPGIEPLSLPAPAAEKTPVTSNNIESVTSSGQNNPIQPIDIGSTDPNVEQDESNESTVEVAKVPPTKSTTSSINHGIEEIVLSDSDSNVPAVVVVPPTPPMTKSQELAMKSLEIINQAVVLFTASNNSVAIQKLMQVRQKALEEQITETDFKSLLQIQKIVREKLGDDK